MEFALGRLAGNIGAASVTASATAGALSAVDFQWEDGADDLQTATLSLPSLSDCPSRKVVLTIVGDGTTKIDDSAARLVVRLLSGPAPEFSVNSLSVDAIRSVAFSAEAAVSYEGKGDVLVEHKEGQLPQGVTLSYVSSDKKVVVSGVPRRAGEYSAVYRVSAVAGGVKTNGGELVVNCRVADPATGGGGTQAERTLAEWTTYTWSNIPVIDVNAKRLTGLLTLTIPTSGKISGKYQHEGGTVTFRADGWDGMDENGVSVAMIGSDGLRLLSVALTGAKKPSVSLSEGVDAAPLRVLMPDIGWSQDFTAEPWRGLYTVGCYNLSAEEGLSNGHIPLSLKITETIDCENGRFIWAGYLPNGKAVSGSSTLSYDGEYDNGMLPIFCHTASDVFSSLQTIAPDGEYLHGLESDHAMNHRLVSAHAAAESFWKHGGAQARYQAFGQYYDPEESLKDCLQANGVGSLTEFFASMTKIADVSVTDQTLVPIGESLLLSVQRETGFLGGCYLNSATGSTRMWRGVLLNGWTGCNCDHPDLPLALGFHWGDDALDGAVQIDTIPAE